MRSLCRLAAMVGAVLVLTGCNFLLDLTAEADLLVDNIEVIPSSSRAINGLSVTFYNYGRSVQGVHYVVVHSADRTIDLSDTTVYEGRVDLRGRSATGIEIAIADIQAYMDAASLASPTEPYVFGVIVDPDDAVPEEIEYNNARGTAQIYYPDSDTPADDEPDDVAVETFEIEFTYGGSATFDAANPIKIFIYDIDESIDLDDAGQWVVDAAGPYSFAEDQIPVPDTNGSGYYMEVFHDVDNDFGPPDYIADIGDTYGVYFEVVTNNIDFDYYGATAVFPAGRYTFHYDPDTYTPPSLAVDSYEIDNDPAYAFHATLPDDQYHTFDIPGDEDWIKVTLAGGERLIVETFSAGGIESDTEVTIYDSALVELAYNDDKLVDEDYYSYIDFVAPAADDYYIRVNEYFGTIGEYSIDIHLF